jgi:hypothetical protein
MSVVRHAINRDQFLLTLRHDSSNVFVQLLLVIGANDAGAAGDRKNHMEIDLCIRVGRCRKFTCRS